jgi:hypothetical protein
MKINKMLLAGLGLALAGTMLWADLSWAQGRGGGGRGAGCPWNQTSQNTWQGQGQGRGQGNPNCPYYPGFRRSQAQGQGPYAQGFQGHRGHRGRGMNAQVNNPDLNQ